MCAQFLTAKRIYDEDDVPEFGKLAFDHFVLEKWDVTSTKTEATQKADLVKAWLELGSRGRLRYYDMQDRVFSTGVVQLPHVPVGVPQRLQTSQQRAQVVEEQPNAMWVRTWYGNKDVSRQEADAAYQKLCEHVGAFHSDFMRGNFAFEDDEELLSDPTSAPTITEATPPYVQAVFGCYPDVLEGGGGLNETDKQRIERGEFIGKQVFMMVIADKRACETGAVLLLSINEFGQMTPERLRVKAADVHQFCVNWDDGQRLAENFREGEEGEVDHLLGDDAWASPVFRVAPGSITY